MRELSTWQALDAAVEACWGPAYAAIHALQAMESHATRIVRGSTMVVALLERAEVLRDQPHYEPQMSVEARNELTTIYHELGGYCEVLLRLYPAGLSAAEDNDHKLKPLRDEALGLLATCQWIANGGGAAARETPEATDPGFEAALGKWRGRTAQLQFEQHGFAALGSDWVLQRRKLRELAVACAGMLARLSEWLAALDHRAQAQRGAWSLIGHSLTAVAEQLADRSVPAGADNWMHSPLAIPMALQDMRQVAALAAEYAIDVRSRALAGAPAG